MRRKGLPTAARRWRNLKHQTDYGVEESWCASVILGTELVQDSVAC